MAARKKKYIAVVFPRDHRQPELVSAPLVYHLECFICYFIVFFAGLNAILLPLNVLDEVA